MLTQTQSVYGCFCGTMAELRTCLKCLPSVPFQDIHVLQNTEYKNTEDKIQKTEQQQGNTYRGALRNLSDRPTTRNL